jgi:hypothetical protein
VQTHEGYVCLLEGGLLGGCLPECLDGHGVLLAFFVEFCELYEEREV